MIYHSARERIGDGAKLSQRLRGERCGGADLWRDSPNRRRVSFESEPSISDQRMGSFFTCARTRIKRKSICVLWSGTRRFEDRFLGAAMWDQQGIMKGETTHAKIQEKYYWPGVTKDVKQWVSWCIAIIVLNMHASAFLVQNDCWHCYQVSIVFIFACGCLLCQVQHCDQCQRTKRKFDRPATQLHPVPVPSYSWKQIGIDLAGPLACIEEENKYIIMVIDYFTKWPEARAAPTKEAFHVANFLFDLFLRYGSPDITISDQGKEFCNQVNTKTTCSISDTGEARFQTQPLPLPGHYNVLHLLDARNVWRYDPVWELWRMVSHELCWTFSPSQR